MAQGLPSLKDVLGGSSGHSRNQLPSLSDVLNGNHQPAAKPERHGGGGFLHGLEHVAGQTVSDLYDTAVHSPSGLYQLSKAVALASAGNPKPLENIAIQTGKGFAEDFRHPLRHPGNTLLDIGAALSLGAGTAARIGEVGRALDAGEGAAAVGRGALKGPKPETRTLNYDGAPVHAGTYSRSAALRSAQKLFDHFHERFPEMRPLPFGVRTFPERVAKELTTHNRYTEQLGRAPAASLARMGKGLSGPQQLALRVVAEGVPIGQRIAFHEKALPNLEGRLARTTKRQIQLLKAAQQYVHDVHGMPRIRPEHADLIHIYEATKNVAGLREGVLGSTTKVARGERVPALTEDIAAGRISAPGRIVQGAHYEVPTPGKLGKSAALAAAARDVERLQRRFDSLYEKQRGKFVTTSRPRTIGEAQQRLDTLEKEHAAALDQFAANYFGPVDKTEVAYRNVHNAKARRQQAGVTRSGRRSGASANKLRIMKTVKAERRVEAERIIEQAIAKNPAHPIAARWNERAQELDQLRQELNPELFDKVDLSRIGKVDESRFVRRHGQLDRVGGALSIAKDRVQQLEIAAAARVKPTGLVGAEDFKGGDFRVPYVADQPKAALFKTAGWKGGNERAPGSVRRGFTGALLKHGVFRNDTTALVAESYLEAHRFAALVGHRDEFLRFAHEAPRSEHDVPIRLDALKDKPWPAIVQRFEDDNQLTPADVQAMGQAYESLREELFPNPQTFTLDPEAHPDVRWIDERLLGGINHPNPLVGVVGGGRRVLNTADAINNASRLAILYLKPAYAVPNMVGNAFLTLVQQGWAAPKNLAAAVRLNSKLGKALAAKVDTAMGEGLTAALHTEQGPLQNVTNVAANFWQAGVDTPFRRAAFLHEARRFGYRTPQDLERLFADPKRAADVAREANSELIDYGRMGRNEQQIIRRIVFFYPWVKGSTVYAARFLGTHPMQAAILGQMGRQGAARDAADLGPLPSYAEGIFKVGERDGMPLTLNPSSAGILNTPAQLVESARELGSGHPGNAFELSQNFTPVVQALLALSARQGVRPNESALSGAGRQLVGGLPVVSTVQGLINPPADSARPRLYPRTRRDVLLHYLMGGAAETPVDLNRARAARYREDHPR